MDDVTAKLTARTDLMSWIAIFSSPSLATTGKRKKQ
jgi:hypothetical protein